MQKFIAVCSYMCYYELEKGMVWRRLNNKLLFKPMLKLSVDILLYKHNIHSKEYMVKKL